MRYSEDVIEEVRSRNDVVDVISGYVKLTKKGSSYFGLCPFHNEKSPSFSVTPGKQMYYCFGCGAGGNVITFIMEYENFSFVEAVKHLANRAGVALPEIEYSKEERIKADKKAVLLEMNKAAANYFFTQLKAEGGAHAREYLDKRKLSLETIRHFGLGYSSKYSDDLYKYLKKKGYSDELLKDSGLVGFHEKYGWQDKFWNRVMFPIMDVNSRVIAFGGRVMGDGEPKYLNSQETLVFDKSRNLYGLNFARTSRANQILICEGYMDVIAMHQAGFTNAVASLGTAFTIGHAMLLKRYTKEVLLVYDSDAAGTKAVLRALPILRDAGLSAKVLRMEPYKDPDEFMKNLGAEEFQKRIDQAENSFLFEIKTIEKEYKLSDPESKNQFFHQVAEKILIFTEELERESYIQSVAGMYHIQPAHLSSLVTTVSMKLSGSRPPVKPKSGIQEKKTEDGVVKAQKFLLTSMIEHPQLFEQLKDIISEEDFTDPIFIRAAGLLFEQYRDGKLNPSAIISRFTEEEEQRRVASLFNTKLNDIETKEEKEKALLETILKVKENGISVQSEKLDPTDLAGLQRIVENKKNLQNMKALHISL